MAQVGDEIYFHAGGKPTCGKIVCHGKHGATVKDDSGTHHKVKWEGVLGHKTRALSEGAMRHFLNSRNLAEITF